MRAAGVVADHAAERAAAMGRRVGAESQLVLLSASAQGVEDDARLDAGETAIRIDFEDPVHVLREVEDDGNVAALAGEARAGTARQHGRTELAADTDRRRDVPGIAGDNESDRD